MMKLNLKKERRKTQRRKTQRKILLIIIIKQDINIKLRGGSWVGVMKVTDI